MDDKTKEVEANEEVEIPVFTPGDRGYMFGFNTIDVGAFGADTFKSADHKFGVVCVRVVQKVTIDHAEKERNASFYTVALLDAKGEIAKNPQNGQPMQYNVPPHELFKNTSDLEEMINAKIEKAITNTKLLLNNSIVDAKSAFKRTSPLAT